MREALPTREEIFFQDFPKCCNFQSGTERRKPDEEVNGMGGNRADDDGGGFMDPEFDLLVFGYVYPPVPPSYEQCADAATSPRADYVIPPLAMGALFDWDDEED
jgi:hypothetical protein